MAKGSIGWCRNFYYNFLTRFGCLKFGDNGYFVIHLVIGVLLDMGDDLERYIDVLGSTISDVVRKEENHDLRH